MTKLFRLFVLNVFVDVVLRLLKSVEVLFYYSVLSVVFWVKLHLTTFYFYNKLKDE